MEVGLLLLRLITGLLAAGHGAQKLFGWFGGHGPRGAAGFVESLGWRPGRRFATLLGLAGTGEAAGAAEPLGAWAVAPPRPRHEVIVLLDDLDKAAARALGYARTLRPLSVTALHVAVDPVHARGLAEQWAQLGLDVPLEIVSCPDRDLPGAVRQALIERMRLDTAVTVLIPQHHYGTLLDWALHDRTAQRLLHALDDLEDGQGAVHLRSCPTTWGRAAAGPRPRQGVDVSGFLRRDGQPAAPPDPRAPRPTGLAARGGWSQETSVSL